MDAIVKQLNRAKSTTITSAGKTAANNRSCPKELEKRDECETYQKKPRHN